MASLIERKFKSGYVYAIQYWEGGKQKRQRVVRPHVPQRRAP
jgi:hypothetical protein